MHRFAVRGFVDEPQHARRRHYDADQEEQQHEPRGPFAPQQTRVDRLTRQRVAKGEDIWRLFQHELDPHQLFDRGQ